MPNFLRYSFLFLFSAFYVNAANIKGRVIDFNEKTPLSNATIKILRQKDSSLVKGLLADNSGNFNIEIPKEEKDLLLSISYVGYENFRKNVDNSSKLGNLIDLGNLELQSNITSSEIVVSADKQQIEYSAGKKVFNVEQSISSQGGNIIDVLRTVPSVNVDADGNVTLRGSGAVNIMIDNKPVSMMGDVNQILQSIPANLLDKVEVITNPGAKYDAEGQSGIINLVLKKKRDDGLNGVISTTIGNVDMYNLSTNLNYKYDNINFFVSGDVGTNRHLRQLRVDSRFYDDKHNLISKVDKNGPQVWNSISSGGRLGMDYTLDERNSFTISGDYRYSNSESSNPNFNKVTSFFNGEELLNYFTSNASGDGPFEYGNLALNYVHNFGEKGFDLTFDAYYFPSYFNLNSYISNTQTDSESIPIENSISNVYRTNTTGLSDSYQFQTDLIYPVAEGTKIETGAKVTLSGVSSDYLFERLDISNNKYYKDELQSSKASHQDNIYAAYINYADKIFGVDLQAGLRAEHTSNEMFDFYQNGNDSVNFNRNFTDFFPNLALSYGFDDQSSLQLSYTRRINRPSGPLLNPYLNKNDSLYWRTGNPQLLPEFTNSFEFGYLKNTNLGVFNAEIFYRHTNQLMNPRFREKIEDNIVLERPLNIGASDAYGVSLSANLDLMKEWKLNLELSGFQQKATGNYENFDYKHESLGWSSKLVSNIMLPENLIIQIYADYSSPVVITQGKRFEFALANLAVRKELFDRKLSLSLNWVDFLNTANFGGNVIGDNFESDLYNRRDFTYVSLTLSYKINDVTRQNRKRGPDGGGGFGNGDGSI